MKEHLLYQTYQMLYIKRYIDIGSFTLPLADIYKSTNNYNGFGISILCLRLWFMFAGLKMNLDAVFQYTGVVLWIVRYNGATDANTDALVFVILIVIFCNYN